MARLAVRQDKLCVCGASVFPLSAVIAVRQDADFRLAARKADLGGTRDILWLGGLMPTYAGQLGMNVQVAYMTSRFHYRRCEAMDALWHCGMHYGPVFAELPDSGGSMPYTEAAALWGGMRETVRKIARMIRRFRPEVLVTQDLRGEYGHPQHRLMAAEIGRHTSELQSPQ